MEQRTSKIKLFLRIPQVDHSGFATLPIEIKSGQPYSS